MLFFLKAFSKMIVAQMGIFNNGHGPSLVYRHPGFGPQQR
jgi:hypothetical protein